MNDQKDSVVNALVEASEGLRYVAGLAERLSVVLDKLDFTQSAEAQAKQYLDLIAATRALAHAKPDPNRVNDSPAGATKKRKTKDPNAPKRPPTAYLLFQGAMRAKTREENPQMGVQEVMSHIASAWGTLSEKDKKPYVEAQDKARAQYSKDFAAWNEKSGEAETHPTPAAKPSKAVKEKEQPKANATKAKATAAAKPAVPTPSKVVATPSKSKDDIVLDTEVESEDGSGSDGSEDSDEEESSDEESSEDELEPQPPKKKAKTASTKPAGKSSKKK